MADTQFPHNGSYEQAAGDAPQSGYGSAAPLLDEMLLARLHAELACERVDGRCDPVLCLLDELGREIRRWRLAQGLTRAVLADKLQMSSGRLASVENGLAQADDISLIQLRVLQTLLPEISASRLALDKYVGALGS